MRIVIDRHPPTRPGDPPDVFVSVSWADHYGTHDRRVTEELPTSPLTPGVTTLLDCVNALADHFDSEEPKLIDAIAKYEQVMEIDREIAKLNQRRRQLGG